MQSTVLPAPRGDEKLLYGSLHENSGIDGVGSKRRKLPVFPNNSLAKNFLEGVRTAPDWGNLILWKIHISSLLLVQKLSLAATKSTYPSRLARIGWDIKNPTQYDADDSLTNFIAKLAG
jgi:hypothetical protein